MFVSALLVTVIKMWAKVVVSLVPLPTRSFTRVMQVDWRSSVCYSLCPPMNDLVIFCLW